MGVKSGVLHYENAGVREDTVPESLNAEHNMMRARFAFGVTSPSIALSLALVNDILTSIGD